MSGPMVTTVSTAPASLTLWQPEASTPDSLVVVRPSTKATKQDCPFAVYRAAIFLYPDGHEVVPSRAENDVQVLRRRIESKCGQTHNERSEAARIR